MASSAFSLLFPGGWTSLEADLKLRLQFLSSYTLIGNKLSIILEISLSQDNLEWLAWMLTIEVPTHFDVLFSNPTNFETGCIWNCFEFELKWFWNKIFCDLCRCAHSRMSLPWPALEFSDKTGSKIKPFLMSSGELSFWTELNRCEVASSRM